MKLGVSVTPSKKSSKKLDVYDLHGKFICSVGAKGYSDYPTYLKTRGQAYADERRRLYKIRHQNDRHKVGSPGYFADMLLW